MTVDSFLRELSLCSLCRQRSDLVQDALKAERMYWGKQQRILTEIHCPKGLAEVRGSGGRAGRGAG